MFPQSSLPPHGRLMPRHWFEQSSLIPAPRAPRSLYEVLWITIERARLSRRGEGSEVQSARNHPRKSKVHSDQSWGDENRLKMSEVHSAAKRAQLNLAPTIKSEAPKQTSTLHSTISQSKVQAAPSCKIYGAEQTGHTGAQ